MSPAEVTQLMADMMEAARKQPQTPVVRQLTAPGEVSPIPVVAQANRIGFVYWSYRGKAIPRTALKAILEARSLEVA